MRRTQASGRAARWVRFLFQYLAGRGRPVIPKKGGGAVIVRVTEELLDKAAWIHSVSWREAHRGLCGREFLDAHSPERQRRYLEEGICGGKEFYLLVMERPVGMVSVAGTLIGDLYVLPREQNQGFGSELLAFAESRCQGDPALWVLEGNEGARRLYRRHGFAETGRRNRIADGIWEIEMEKARRTGRKTEGGWA